ncbi:hypothetical protein EW145_g1458 [Phellinidium pouzarii]|uniref:RING-type domain-containing protein n=1 Tax=Phellinidium pouzarii TaxID=167371 RepID=A0A4S4LJX0_9AGAM|nr:hypothetical protein EW145_g1458 [Phellinidium pouzarii]
MTPVEHGAVHTLNDKSEQSPDDVHAHANVLSDVTVGVGADRGTSKRTGNAALASHRQTVIETETETETTSRTPAGTWSGSEPECRLLRVHDADHPVQRLSGHVRSGNSPRLSFTSLPATPISDAKPVVMYDPADIYAPLLHCPACSPPALLVAPTTLHCGHTVCSRHVRRPRTDHSSSSTHASSPSQKEATPSRVPSARERSIGPPPPMGSIIPSCPLPTCHPGTAQQSLAVNLPPESSVAYYPPLVQPVVSGHPDQVRVTVTDPRIDVSVGRVLGLLEKARKQVGGSERVERRENCSDDETDEDVEGNREEEMVESSASASTSSLDRRRRTSSKPYKRLRTDEHSEGIHHQRPRATPATREELEDRFHKDLQESFACEICYMLLYQPVTTPCQHTFCAKCLQRSLDHGSKCPLCRQSMPPFSYFQDHPYNKVILALLLKAFPEIYEERGRSIEDEERNTRLDTPIFVYQLSFPGMPTLLHFFEPRYRLMLRRCLESPTPCFGMITSPRTVGSSGGDYGTMLEIRSVQMLPDGRSMVETWGIYRFRVLETGTLDGYMELVLKIIFKGG